MSILGGEIKYEITTEGLFIPKVQRNIVHFISNMTG